MKRVLCIVGSMNAGGAETFIMKIYRCIDKSQYQFDFAVGTNEKGFYDNEIFRLGGKIFCITPKSHGVIHNFMDIKSVVRKNDYHYVLRISQHSLSALELLAARIGGAEIRVFRSSNSNTTTGSIKAFLLHKIFIFMPLLFANVRIAPSTESAEYMFGKNCLKKRKAHLVHNAVDLEYYKFVEKNRLKVRKEFSLEDKLVIGHIGRFNQQKNHIFLVDVFFEIKKIMPNAMLLLIGIGETKEKVIEYARRKGIEESIILAGIRDDIPSILSAMDVFVFPSLYEGMPNTVLEAQATGLPCIISDTITKEVAITPIVYYLSLNIKASEWAKKAISIAHSNRYEPYEDFVKAGYDIGSATKEFTNLVFKE